MKRISLTLVLAAWICFGCSGPISEGGSESYLTIEKGGICLKNDRTEDCNRSTESVYWLHGGKQGLVMEQFTSELTNQPANWVGHKASKPLQEGKYKLTNERGTFILEGNGVKRKIDGKNGAMLYVDQKGRVSFMEKDQRASAPLHKIQLREKVLHQDKIPFGQRMLIGNYPVLKKAAELAMITVVQGDERSRIIPNDTGTEIILEDILRAINCCSTAGDLDCCDSGGGKGRGVQLALKPELTLAADIPNLKEMGSYFPEPAMATTIITGSWKTVMTLVAADVCLYRSGPYLIIIDCLTGEIWCLDSDECIILLESNAEGEIQVMVKEECHAFDGIAPCA